MYNAKYIILDGCAIIFSAAISHKSMAGHVKCDGAGFVTFHMDEDGVYARCTGESVTLGIKSRSKEDEEIINRQIIKR